MHKYVNHFPGDFSNEVVIALALLVLAETVIIWFWSRRRRGLRGRLEAALEAAGSAATHAASALAVDALRPAERDVDSEVTPAAPIIPTASHDQVAGGAIEAAATAITPPAAAPANGSPSSAVHLLLVEDDVDVARPYRLLLESRGYTVRHAADGVEGLDAARRERPDLLLLDVMMPRMNGISLLQTLRDDANLRTIPAVVLSNFHEHRVVERAMALGALAYIVKSQMRPDTLVGAIPHWLRGERVVDA